MTALDAAIRERLDEYEQGDSLERHDDALRAVLDLHTPAVLYAPVRTPVKERDNECPYCGRYALIRERRDKAGFPWHDHVNPDPWCVVCNDEEIDESAPWPCPTLVAIARALGVDVPGGGS